MKFFFLFFLLPFSQINHLVSLTSPKNHRLHQLTLGTRGLLFQAMQAQGSLQKAALTSLGAMV